MNQALYAHMNNKRKMKKKGILSKAIHMFNALPIKPLMTFITKIKNVL
jgi:hypothetical protein